MAGLKRVTADLSRYRREWQAKLAQAGESVGSPGSRPSSALVETTSFGDNPGGLRMFSYAPEGLSTEAPLVVALHGCTQTAAGYDHGVGWSTLADRYGFAVLAPEQQRSNNQASCFNWFQPNDTRRDRGEARSIRDMVGAAIDANRLDARRVFITGLSAGGAMTSVMLATYPEVFAGGAIIAGLPYGAASNVQQALECMNGGKPRPAREWGYLVRRASAHKGPWPKVSIWHGDADHTVQPMNAGEIIKQWTDLHGVPLYPSEANTLDGRQHRVWRDAGGDAVIESHAIAGMAHGTPIASGAAADQCGAAAPFILDVGISSSFHIASFWGLTGTPRERADPVRDGRDPAALLPGGVQPSGVAKAAAPPRKAHGPGPADPQAVIEGALRAAGLLKR